VYLQAVLLSRALNSIGVHISSTIFVEHLCMQIKTSLISVYQLLDAYAFSQDKIEN